MLWYLFKAVSTGFDGVDAAAAQGDFAAVLADPVGMVAWTLVGLAITGLIIYAGVEKGIEKNLDKILRPITRGLKIEIDPAKLKPAEAAKPLKKTSDERRLVRLCPKLSDGAGQLLGWTRKPLAALLVS